MLLEIKCDKFRIQPTPFKLGLNVIEGSDDGGNSIGKSTFLMIIDFVLGGSDYLNKSLDVHSNIGEHNIFFAFDFGGKIYRYCRNTVAKSKVYICDEHYNITGDISIETYLQNLKMAYHLNYSGLSFRNEIGRYFRIYGRENLQERKPLHLFHAESEEKCIDSLLKLFNKYGAILESIKQLEGLKQEKKAIDNANAYNIIKKIGSRAYKVNKQKIDELDSKINSILAETESGLNDSNSVVTEEILRLKQDLSRLRRSRSKNLSEKDRLTKCKSSKISPEQLDQLKRYFPEIDAKEIIEYENFHESIKKILNNQITEELQRYNIIINELSQAIASLELQIKEYHSLQSLSKSVLLQLTALQKEKEKLYNENIFYEKYVAIQRDISDLKEYIDKIKQTNLEQIELNINTKMEKLNDYIYNAQNKAPIIKLNNSSYSFKTPDDTGTGTSYKSMIVFDLAMLDLTSLPILLHDSYLLKQIQDNALEKILELYSNSKKQVFISIDKVSGLTKKSRVIVDTNRVLSLYPNGGELFGCCWNKKYTNP